jgi:hypothetical protein
MYAEPTEETDIRIRARRAVKGIWEFVPKGVTLQLVFQEHDKVLDFWHEVPDMTQGTRAQTAPTA